MIDQIFLTTSDRGMESVPTTSANSGLSFTAFPAPRGLAVRLAGLSPFAFLEFFFFEAARQSSSEPSSSSSELPPFLLLPRPALRPPFLFPTTFLPGLYSSSLPSSYEDCLIRKTTKDLTVKCLTLLSDSSSNSSNSLPDSCLRFFAGFTSSSLSSLSSSCWIGKDYAKINPNPRKTYNWSRLSCTLSSASRLGRRSSFFLFRFFRLLRKVTYVKGIFTALKMQIIIPRTSLRSR